MRAMLVAAGLGTRLAPLTELLPKPAIPIAGRPAAAFVMQHLAEVGVTEFYANAFHLPVELEREMRAWLPVNTKLSIVRESRLLGTGGGVRHAFDPEAGESFIVANAKILFAPDVKRALAVHCSMNALATMILRPMPKGASFGPVDIDESGRVVGLLQPHLSANGVIGRRRCMFTGVQVMSARAWKQLPSEGCAVRDGYVKWLRAGAVIAASVQDGEFRDVGTSLQAYHEANMAVLRGAFAWSGIHPDAASNVIASSASLGPGASLEECVVGARATVAPGARLRRSIVWPGVSVGSSGNSQIHTPAGVIQLP